MKMKDLGCHSSFMPDLPICWGPCPAPVWLAGTESSAPPTALASVCPPTPDSRRCRPRKPKRGEPSFTERSPTAISETTGFRGVPLGKNAHWRKREHGDSKRPECQDSGAVLFLMPCCLPAFLPAH